MANVEDLYLGFGYSIKDQVIYMGRNQDVNSRLVGSSTFFGIVAQCPGEL
jgi:hypothetical protein